MSEIRFNPRTGKREIIDPRGGLRGGLRPTPIFNKPKPLPPKQGLRPIPPTPGMDRRDYFEKLQAQGFEIPTGAIIDPLEEDSQTCQTYKALVVFPVYKT